MTQTALEASIVPRLTFFTRRDCPLCDAAWFVVRKVATHTDVLVEKVDIDAPGMEKWAALYGQDIPVLHLDGSEIFRHHVPERELRRLLATRPTR
jgi:hypothetical protein